MDVIAHDFGLMGAAVIDLMAHINDTHWADDSPAGIECAEDSTLGEKYPARPATPVVGAHLEACSSLVTVGDHLRGMWAAQDLSCRRSPLDR